MIIGSTIVVLALTLGCDQRAVRIATSTPIPTAIVLPAPTGLGLGTYSSGLPATLGWQPYPDPDATFELQWRFADVGIWQPMGEAPAGSTHVGDQPGIVGYKGNFVTYCYRVRALKGELASAWSQELCKYVGAGESSTYEKLRWAPPITGLVLNEGHGGVAVSWEPVDPSRRDGVRFEVWRRNRNDSIYVTVANVRGFETQFFDDAAAPDSCYRIHVIADGPSSLSPEVCLPAQQ